MTILIIGFTCPPTIHFKFIQSTTSVTLQSATAYFITKGDGLLSQSATAFFYYKVRQVLLQRARVITKCDRTGVLKKG